MASTSYISTHILTKRMTRTSCSSFHRQGISTHILTKRMTNMKSHSFGLMNISTHILTKRMTLTDNNVLRPVLFQLTSSRRGWRYMQGQTVVSHRISTHILTKRMTSIPEIPTNPPCHFNSHPHEEDDCIIPVNTSSSKAFQLTSSRRGWLTLCGWLLYTQHISTHILTKRMTVTLNSVTVWEYISTHILTKRMTEDAEGGDVLLAFQLTSSRRGWLLPMVCLCGLSHFNSHPHEEDDRNRRHSENGVEISTHILTKRMTAILNKNNLFKIAYYISNKHFISIVDIFFHFHIYF